MPLPPAADVHYRAQRRIAAAALATARRLWAQIDPAAIERSSAAIVPRLASLITTAQLRAADDGVAYTAEVLAQQNLDPTIDGRVVTARFAGTASSDATLDTVLATPALRSLHQIATGAPITNAMQSGLVLLEGIVLTQIADANRGAVGVATVASPAAGGYVRMLNAPSCDRCAVLAGKWYRWNQGFSRHPRCDCRHIPTTESIAGDLTTDPRAAIEAGQVTGLSRADTRAILEDNADVGQIINARRGMTRLGTSEGTTRRGSYGRRRRSEGTTGPRLRPEQIYRAAGNDRNAALLLLRRYGYLA